MIAVDWSHTKDLTTYDGKKVRTEDVKSLSKRIRVGESNPSLHPSLVLEQGCPLSLLYNLAKAGAEVYVIDNKATERYRKEHGIEKSDENDAKIIWELATLGEKLIPINLDDKLLRLHDLYHQYCRYQKARIAMENMRRAHIRQFGGGESIETEESILFSQPPSDLFPYDSSVETLKQREKTLLAEMQALAPILPKTLPIKGLGNRLWIGFMVTSDPLNFKCLSAYLRFCGLTGDVVKTHKYNRHARMLYHLLAESVVMHKDPEFRNIYDKCKADIREKYQDYTKGHVHYAALNRTATFLAKRIYQYRKETGSVFNI